MRKNEFIQYVKRPGALNCDKTHELQDLVKTFPWFQTAQILLCRNLKVCENIGFEEQLRLTAAYAGDRVRLHQLIMETAVEKTHVPNKSQASEKSPASDTIEAKNRTKNKPLEEVEPAEKIKEKNPSPQEISIEEKLLSESKNEKKQEFPEEEFLNRQILSHAISNSNLLGNAESEEEIPEHIHLEKVPIEEERAEENPLEEIQNRGDNFDESTEHSFGEWLQHFDEPAHNSREVQKEDQQFKIDEDKKNLLVKSQGKVSFYNPTEMAKLSVKEDDDLITETLAKIYVQQGNIEKAIKAYNKLSLKYPEKKVYFASQIRKLENQL